MTRPPIFESNKIAVVNAGMWPIMNYAMLYDQSTFNASPPSSNGTKSPTIANPQGYWPYTPHWPYIVPFNSTSPQGYFPPYYNAANGSTEEVEH